MADEPKTADAGNVTAAMTPASQVAPPAGDKPGDGKGTPDWESAALKYKAQSDRLGQQVDTLTKRLDTLQAQHMTDSEKVAKKAADEASAPFRQETEELRRFITDRLEAKRATLTPEQKALIPFGLKPEQEFDLVDRISGFKMAKEPSQLGGPVPPHETRPKTYTNQEFEDWREMASSTNPVTRAKYHELKQEMQAAYKSGRVEGYGTKRG